MLEFISHTIDIINTFKCSQTQAQAQAQPQPQRALKTTAARAELASNLIQFNLIN